MACELSLRKSNLTDNTVQPIIHRLEAKVQ